MTHGVGIIGAGPGVAALHLPTLARLSPDFEVVHIADSGSGRAVGLAERVDARSSSGIEQLLADERVTVVLVCSPPREHAAQILAAVAAGKRAILCEKPLATTIADAEAVIDACRGAGVALLVGTNHLYDPAWMRAKHHLIAGGHRVRAICVTMALPPNARYHDVVSESVAQPPAPVRGGPPLEVPQVAASVVHQLITGLAVHDLPVIRDLAPVFEELVFARAIEPIGYAVGFRASGIPIRLATVMLPDGADSGGSDTVWRLDITTDADLVEVVFPPPFVHAGSASVRVSTPAGRVTTFPSTDENGYLVEWRALADVLRGSDVVEYDELLDDARYAISLADAAAEMIERGVR